MKEINTEIELEYTFLPSHLPEDLRDAPVKRLIDVYVPEVGVVHPNLRLRQKGDSYTITKKVKLSENDASAHNEITIPLSNIEFTALSGSSNRKIVKDRYFIKIDGYDAEVDIFLGSLSGLVLIDFEFNNIEDQRSFVKPSLCLADVTQEDFIAGGMLAGKSYDLISNDLRRFDYKPLSIKN